MKDRKDRNVYDVMNEVDTSEEYMDFSKEEADACVNRLRRRIKSPAKSHRWQKAVAGLAAVIVLSGGGLAYAAGNGSLSWFFGKLSKETGNVIPSKYVDKSYIDNEYKGDVNVITDSDARVSFDVKKVAVDGDELNIAMVVTYDDFDTKKYEDFDTPMEIMDGGRDITDGSFGCTANGDGIELTDKQIMFDIVYTLKQKNVYKVGDVITVKCDSLIMHNKNNEDGDNTAYVSDEVSGPWTMQLKIQDDMQRHNVDVSGQAVVDKCSINSRLINMHIADTAQAGLNTDALEDVVLEMTDKNKLSDVCHASGMYGLDDKIEEISLSFIKPIDVSQVEAVWIGGVRCPVK